MAELLLEIGCEEIPARMLPEALNHLKSALESALAGATLDHGELVCHGTPRRLMAGVSGLAERQRDVEIIKRGPAAASAFQADGAPTPALQGFMRSSGATVALLERQPTPKGDYLIFRQQVPGRLASEVLPGLLVEIIRAFPWPKSMRWGNGDLRFVRPLHTLTALLDGAVLELSLPLDENTALVAGNQVLGHRFMSPGPHQVSGIADYIRVMTSAWVMLNLEDRKAHIRRRVTELAAEVGGTPMLDEGLVSETACLTEWPVPLLGRFDERFLEIPPEVLVTSMKYHQKYFAIRGGDGKLLPCFVAVANVEASDPTVLVRGYQRVLRARLEDAAFYWNEDRKVALAERREALRNVVFQAKLGTLFAKTERMALLAGVIAHKVAVSQIAQAVQAAELCKCDLVTGMVGEFPELQGIMGAYYAREQGVTDEVAAAIREHYQPQGGKDSLPSSDLGAIVSLADKIDTLVGFFGVGLEPSGNKDPFALRRAALGVIRIIREKRWDLPLLHLFGHAYSYYGSGLLMPAMEETIEKLGSFVKLRYEYHLINSDVLYDIINSVMAHESFGRFDLVDASERVEAVSEFKKLDACEELVATNKRIRNIVQQYIAKISATLPLKVDDLLMGDEEKILHRVYERCRLQVENLLLEKKYTEAMKVLSELREPINIFFDKVMVMVDDPRVRDSRIALLHHVLETCSAVAVISELVVSGDQEK